MSTLTPRFLALVLLAGVTVSDAFALPHQVHRDEVKHCSFLGNVHGTSKQGKHHDWKNVAKHRALVKAKKLGATHVVWYHIQHIGSFNGEVDGKAYACHNTPHHESKH